MPLIQTGFVNYGVVATIANGQAISGAIPLGGMSLVGIYLPAAFTGTALTFLACNTIDGTFLPVVNSSGAISYTVAQGDYVAIDPSPFAGIAFLQIKSGSTEGAARTLSCSLKGI